MKTLGGYYLSFYLEPLIYQLPADSFLVFPSSSTTKVGIFVSVSFYILLPFPFWNIKLYQWYPVFAYYQIVYHCHLTLPGSITWQIWTVLSQGNLIINFVLNLTYQTVLLTIDGTKTDIINSFGQLLQGGLFLHKVIASLSLVHPEFDKLLHLLYKL